MILFNCHPYPAFRIPDFTPIYGDMAVNCWFRAYLKRDKTCSKDVQIEKQDKYKMSKC